MARIRPGAERDPALEARAGRRSSEVRVRKRTDSRRDLAPEAGASRQSG